MTEFTPEEIEGQIFFKTIYAQAFRPLIVSNEDELIQKIATEHIDVLIKSTTRESAEVRLTGMVKYALSVGVTRLGSLEKIGIQLASDILESYTELEQQGVLAILEAIYKNTSPLLLAETDEQLVRDWSFVVMGWNSVASETKLFLL